MIDNGVSSGQGHGLNRTLGGTRLISWIFPYSLLVFVPVSIALHLLHFNAILVSVLTILAAIPVTALLGKSTQNLSIRSGTIVGGLLNVTFGNAFEIMIGILAIRVGLIDMVKASLVGSVIQNILLVVGLSMFCGGLRYKEQKFNRSSVGVASTMLLIAAAGLALPTVYTALNGNAPPVMSKAVAVTLGITYILSLVFALYTHRHLFRTQLDPGEKDGWGTRKALLVLLITVVLAGVESQILVSNIESVVQTTQISQVFIGLVVIGIIGNIPELFTAVSLAIKNKITQSMEIGMNSATQIALFAIPILVFVSPLVGGELTLAFAPFQLAAMILAVMIINYLGSDGICNWLEGVQLMAVYIIIAIAFFYI